MAWWVTCAGPFCPIFWGRPQSKPSEARWVARGIDLKEDTSTKTSMLARFWGQTPIEGSGLAWSGCRRRSLLPHFWGQTPIQTKRGTLDSPWNHLVVPVAHGSERLVDTLNRTLARYPSHPRPLYFEGQMLQKWVRVSFNDAMTLFVRLADLSHNWTDSRRCYPPRIESGLGSTA